MRKTARRHAQAGPVAKGSKKKRGGLGRSLKKGLGKAAKFAKKGIKLGGSLAGLVLPGAIGKGISFATGLIPENGGGGELAGLGGGPAAMKMGRLGGMHRRYRRINPGNSKAMRRAIRRIHAGARLYSKFFAITHGKRIAGTPVHVKPHHKRAA